jgi:PadR family transcriptional regulator PadR
MFLWIIEGSKRAMADKSGVMGKPGALVQGTLDMLILKTLDLQPMHGYGIAMRIEQISKGVFQVNPGSLFPAFRRLERAGWLSSEWRETENNRRAKYYALTALGRRQLKGGNGRGRRRQLREFWKRSHRETQNGAAEEFAGGLTRLVSEGASGARDG